jgi:hypothetical protein
MSIRRVRGSFRDPGTGRRFGNVDPGSYCNRHSTWIYRDEEWRLLYGSYTTSPFLRSFPARHTYMRGIQCFCFRSLEAAGAYMLCATGKKVIHAKLIYYKL